MRANILASFFDYLGDALERFNPSAFRFLAAALPYLTPVPVAWLTAHSSSEFLHFTPTVSFIFVFALEGIGLWFTTLLVDAVVDWVRSRNWKSFVPVVLFVLTVSSYVYLLVNLNVTLESASGNVNPALSKVITLLCFLPLITGIGNGYYKLKLDYETDMEVAKQREQELQVLKMQQDSELRQREQENEFRKLQEQHNLELQKLQEINNLKLQKFRIKQETSRTTSETSKRLPEVTSRTRHTSETTSGSSKMGRPSVHQEKVFSYLEDVYQRTGEVPSFTEVMKELGLSQSTASRLRNEWLDTKQ